MTWFADLTPYSYLPAKKSDCGSHPTFNVGWLAAAHPFPSGDLDARLTTYLGRIVEWARINQTRGWQHCEFCRLDDPSAGSAEIRVVGGDGTRYAAPTLIHHYVAAHRYRPPEPFVEALRRLVGRAEEGGDRCLACGEPIPRTADPGYFDVICGGCEIANDVRRFNSG